jgi:hypothetical protein
MSAGNADEIAQDIDDFKIALLYATGLIELYF